MKPETKFKNRALKVLNAIPNCWFEVINQRCITGTPDVLGCVNGYFVALEFKSSDKAKVTKLQEYKLNKIITANGFGVVVTPSNIEHVYGVVKELSNSR